jgi:hypothetical protein
MDMDDVAYKLCDEHSRTTTLCSLEEMEAAQVTPAAPGSKKLCCQDITDTGKSIRNKISLTDKIPTYNWQSYVKVPESTESDQRNGKLRMQFRGYATRHFSPAVTSSWKYYLRQEPSIDRNKRVPRPVPATIYTRHRDIFTTHKVSAMAWH